MRIRKDGEATREKILEAASLVFGEKGFHKATHAEISRIAGVNSALINFHFRSKDALYRAVWEHIADEVEELYPIDGGIPAGAPAAERLRGLIRALLNRAMDDRLARFHRIRMVEFINPTGLLDEAFFRRLQHHRAYTLKIMLDLLGPKATDTDLELCEMSVVSQCLIFKPPPHAKGPPFTRLGVDCLAEHVTRFALAGIEAIRRQIESAGGRKQDGSR